MKMKRWNSLLLIEPIRSGPYQKAIEKRGPGLHHLAIDVSHLEEYIESLAGSGWLLHPLSIKTIKQIQIAYLARPGFPSLIEVQQKENWNESENINNLFITEVFAPMDTKFLPLIQSLNLETVVKPSTNGLQFTMGGHTIKMQDLL